MKGKEDKKSRVKVVYWRNHYKKLYNHSIEVVALSSGSRSHHYLIACRAGRVLQSSWKNFFFFSSLFCFMKVFNNRILSSPPLNSESCYFRYLRFKEGLKCFKHFPDILGTPLFLFLISKTLSFVITKLWFESLLKDHFSPIRH